MASNWNEIINEALSAFSLFQFRGSNHLIMPRHYSGEHYQWDWVIWRIEQRDASNLSQKSMHRQFCFFKQMFSVVDARTVKEAKIQYKAHEIFNVAQDLVSFFLCFSFPEWKCRAANFPRTCFLAHHSPSTAKQSDARLSRALIKFQFQTKAFKMRLFNRSAASIVIV